MKPLGTLVIDRLKKRKMTDVAQAAFVLEKTLQIIENHWGEQSRKSILPWKYVNGKIYLKSGNGAWRQEITKNKASILSLLHIEIPNAPITQLIIL